MLQLIVFGLVAVVGIYAYKKLREALNELDEQDRRARPAPAKVKKDPVDTLKPDPKTGIYRIDDK